MIMLHVNSVCYHNYIILADYPLDQYIAGARPRLGPGNYTPSRSAPECNLPQQPNACNAECE